MRHRVVIIEPTAAAAQRLARVATVASGMQEAVVVETVAAALEHNPTALAYGGPFVEDVLAHPDLRRLPSVVWTANPSAELFKQATSVDGESIAAILGWPSYMAAPRSWEALLALRNALAGGPTAPRVVPIAVELLSTGAAVLDWRVATTADRDDTIAELSRFAATVAGRQAEKIGEVAYELLMNALYDAPTTPDGKYLYAHDRNANVQLLPEQAATCRVASDGNHLVVEVIDPFGGLRRPVVMRSLARVMAALKAGGAQDALDTSHGGAGLGLHRVFTGAAATLIHVVPQQETRVCAWFDLTLSARDLRAMPGSLHFYRGEST